MKNRRLWLGLAFISPWVVNFCVFTIYPLISAIYYSLCDYCVLTPAYFVGMRNYTDMASDHLFWLALVNTLIFAVIYLPLSIGAALFLALLLNLRIPAQGLLRTIYFLPTIVPAVCLAVVWQWLLHGDGGLVNILIDPVLQTCNGIFGTHLEPPNWLAQPGSARVALVFASLWTLGNTVLIFLAALRDVPTHLYEAAEIDGASHLQKYLHITLPSISPVIFFIIISGLIGVMQTFAVPYVLANGTDGPGRSLLFLSTYIFQNAFQYWSMGYACALSLVLFLLILILSLTMMRLSAKRIYSAAD